MPDPVSGLQFDTAEPTQQGSVSEARCVACGDKLAEYFEVNGKIACLRCKDRAVAAAGGSHVPTFLKATGLGLVAAAAGSALYYAVAALTGYEIGIIAIVVGLLVGFAVRKGSRARGGWRYQALAMFLTYLAIASTYVPRVFQAIEAQKAQSPAPTAPGAPATGAPTAGTPAVVAPAAAPGAPVSTAGAPVAVAPAPGTAAPGAPATASGAPAAPQDTAPAHATASPTAPAAAPEPQPPAKDPTFGDFIVAVGMLLAFALALPFLAGFENAIGLLIIAIGLYEAWKVNRIAALSVSGPYTVGAPKAAGA